MPFSEECFPVTIGKDWYDNYQNEEIFYMDDVGQQGVSQWRTIINMVSAVKILNDIISNSFKPIRMISFLGMFGSTLFLLYIIVVVFLVVFLNMTWIAPQGWISLATIIGCMFFLLFSCLTIMSEYLIRIMDETRDEPLYFISQEFDSSHFMGKVSHKRSSRLNIVKV